MWKFRALIDDSPGAGRNRPGGPLHLSPDDLAQLDDARLLALEEGRLAALSVKLAANMNKARECPWQNPRTLSVTTTLTRFTQATCRPSGRCGEDAAPRRTPCVRSRQGAGSLPCSTAKDSGCEPDGVTVQVRLREEPGTNCRRAEILRHRRSCCWIRPAAPERGNG